MAEHNQAGVATSEKESKNVSLHKFLIHHRGDHVGVAVQDIKKGEKVIGIFMDDESQIDVEAKDDIPLGHKIAIVPLEKNSPVIKYGIQIGVTTEDIALGDYVHTHNLKTARW